MHADNICRENEEAGGGGASTKYLLVIQICSLSLKTSLYGSSPKVEDVFCRDLCLSKAAKHRTKSNAAFMLVA